MADRCDDAALAELIGAIEAGERDELARVDRLLADHSEDPRLHFLRGSLLAGIGRPIEALSALKRAVEIEPDFTIARFQLGFFQLTSGEAADALATWGPLALLPEGHYLRSFVGGLTHLIRDEFDRSVALLDTGISENNENVPLNRDMSLIVDRVRELLVPPATAPAEASATSLLLGQLSVR